MKLARIRTTKDIRIASGGVNLSHDSFTVATKDNPAGFAKVEALEEVPGGVRLVAEKLDLFIPWSSVIFAEISDWDPAPDAEPKSLAQAPAASALPSHDDKAKDDDKPKGKK